MFEHAVHGSEGALGAVGVLQRLIDAEGREAQAVRLAEDVQRVERGQ